MNGEINASTECELGLGIKKINLRIRTSIHPQKQTKMQHNQSSPIHKQMTFMTRCVSLHQSKRLTNQPAKVLK